MNLTEAMKGRHSVRQYTDQPLNEAVISALQKEIDACNQESGLHIQLVTNEPKAFDGFMAHYGKFSGVTDYIAMIGKKGPTWMRPAATTESGWCCWPSNWDSTPAGWP